MKNVFILILILITPLFETNAQVSLDWANRTGGTNIDRGFSVYVDDFGFIYTTGSFWGKVDFDPSGDTMNLTAISGRDVYVTKMDQYGSLVWAKSLMGLGEGLSVTANSNGDVYITGYFCGATIDADPGPDTFNLINAGGVGVNCADIFVCKLDRNGHFKWATSIGSVGSEKSHSISVAPNGDVVIAGFFANTIDFDPSGSIYNLTSIGGLDIFILKLGSDGSFMWVKQLGNINSERATYVDIDNSGNIYTTGYHTSSLDFDPGAGTYLLPCSATFCNYLLKIDPNGNFIWAKSINGGPTGPEPKVHVDEFGNSYLGSYFHGTVDFDPSVGTYFMTSVGSSDGYVSKFDQNGNFKWAKSFGGSSDDFTVGITVDTKQDVYVGGVFSGSADFDPDSGIFILTSLGNSDISITKIDSNGSFIWAKKAGGLSTDVINSIAIDSKRNIYTTGYFWQTGDFDPNYNNFSLISQGAEDIYLAKYVQNGIMGYVYLDLNQNCFFDSTEVGLKNRRAIINPGNIVVETNDNGLWYIDSLLPGNYTIRFDTIGKYHATCPSSYSFNVSNNDSMTIVSNFGLVSTEPCPKPSISVNAPILRRCFSNQSVYIEACNLYEATSILNNAYVELELDTLIIPASSTLPYTVMGNGKYRFNIDTLYQGQCTSFSINANVSCNAALGQTLCIKASLFPADSCVFDTIAEDAPPDFTPCFLPWDKSSIKVNGWCSNDSIYFSIKNNGVFGNGDMDCFAPLRLYIDGDYVVLDSIRLMGGESDTLIFVGNGKTWRLEVDQHLLHPGTSHPNATIERCGNIVNWTPNLVNILPMDDADPIVDIYCGVVTGSFDPNDKTGYPLGVTDSHYVSPNGNLDYVIRFQNTGTDTAFTVVIRDTLDEDLDIFSVASGVSSHDYIFRMHGPRVLEWTFYNILLPDSNSNEPLSHGFVTFKVLQNRNLPDGTEINNRVGIYFDYNAPVITNTTSHIIHRAIQQSTWTAQKNLSAQACDQYTLNGYVYNQSGSYWQIVSNGSLDTLLNLNVNITRSTSSVVNATSCNSYTAPDGAVYNTSGLKTAMIPNSNGCDSTITIDLTINASSAIITETTCGSYTAPDGAVYNNSGIMTAVIPNALGCDSTITINLTVNQPQTIILNETACGSYSFGSQTLTQSGLYSDTLLSASGCDSIVSLNLTMQNSDTVIVESTCGTYTLNGQIYSQPGTYIQTIPNSLGCDSTITLDLLLLPSDSVFLNVATCYNYFFDNQTYTQSGLYSQTYTNSSGCDSIVVLTLDIVDTLTTNINQFACDNYFFNGQSLTQSGVYTDVLSSSSGCDSIVTLNLEISNSKMVTLNETACNSYVFNGQTLTQSGTYSAGLSTQAGCDSMITLNLAINSANTFVTQNGSLLAAVASGANYQWVDCNNGNSAISGATAQTYTATLNGSYAVQVTENGCTETSGCFTVTGVGIEDEAFYGIPLLYPNPASEKLIVDLSAMKNISDVSVEVYESSGKLVSSIYRYKVADKLIEMDVNMLASGFYFIDLKSAGKTIARAKFVKE